mmetsp:Transcript_3290/g.6974  ORF Transcript_3290/g.6974 Transcript_3290/m.6974 type:complete len:236 (-) Transcript_3290:452-1159(-)
MVLCRDGFLRLPHLLGVEFDAIHLLRHLPHIHHIVLRSLLVLLQLELRLTLLVQCRVPVLHQTDERPGFLHGVDFLDHIAAQRQTKELANLVLAGKFIRDAFHQDCPGARMRQSLQPLEASNQKFLLCIIDQGLHGVANVSHKQCLDVVQPRMADHHISHADLAETWNFWPTLTEEEVERAQDADAHPPDANANGKCQLNELQHHHRVQTKCFRQLFVCLHLEAHFHPAKVCLFR